MTNKRKVYIESLHKSSYMVRIGVFNPEYVWEIVKEAYPFPSSCRFKLSDFFVKENIEQPENEKQNKNLEKIVKSSDTASSELFDSSVPAEIRLPSRNEMDDFKRVIENVEIYVGRKKLHFGLGAMVAGGAYDKIRPMAGLIERLRRNWQRRRKCPFKFLDRSLKKDRRLQGDFTTNDIYDNFTYYLGMRPADGEGFSIEPEIIYKKEFYKYVFEKWKKEGHICVDKRETELDMRKFFEELGILLSKIENMIESSYRSMGHSRSPSVDLFLYADLRTIKDSACDPNENNFDYLRENEYSLENGTFIMKNHQGKPDKRIYLKPKHSLETDDLFGSFTKGKPYRVINPAKEKETIFEQFFGKIESNRPSIPCWTLLDKLGEGVFGEVWRAENAGRIRALKIVKETAFNHELVEKKSGCKDWKEYIKSELYYGDLDKLSTPFVLKAGTVFEVTDKATGTSCWVVDSEVCKCTLESLGGKLEDKAMRYSTELIDAMTDCHTNPKLEKPIIHKDMKPCNILIGLDDHIRVNDFGALYDFTALPGHNNVLGAVYFKPPEVIESDLGINPNLKYDARSNVFSIGGLVYWMHTGRNPFTISGEKLKDPMEERKRIHEAMYKQIRANNIDWNLLEEKAGRQVKRILKKCLEKDPAKRYQNAAELRKDWYETFKLPSQ